LLLNNLLILITEILGLEKKYRSDNELNLLSFSARPSGGKLKQGELSPLNYPPLFLECPSEIACMFIVFAQF
jgi:hypothetical protein